MQWVASGEKWLVVGAHFGSAVPSSLREVALVVGCWLLVVFWANDS
jgi:hypothetical protein